MKRLIVSLLLLATVALMSAPAFAQSKMFVVFTANWCASCRSIIPIVQEVGSQNAITVKLIDVDSASAPKQAKQMGLDIPGRDLPQVYLYNQGSSVLVLDGSQYGYGQNDQVRATLLRNLQQSR